MKFNEILAKKTGREEISGRVKEKTLNICVDAGSTETRSIYVDFDSISSGTIQSEVVTMETATVNLKAPIRGLRTAPELSDNLEVIITTSKEVHHLAKGSIKKYLSKEPQRMSANASKVDQKLTRQSIIFQLALNALCDAINTDTLADVYNINLIMSLPSEDISVTRVEKITSNIKGTSCIEFPRLGKTLTINVETVEVYAEPIAAAHHYIITNADADNQNIVFLDCGGRSKGAVLSVDSELVLDGTVSDTGGGERFVTEVAKNISVRLGTNIPPVSKVRDGLETANIKIGTDIIDISDDIDQAKYELAEDCVATINKLLDINNMPIESIQRIVCTGRAFLPSVRNGQIVSRSLVDFIEDEIRDLDIPITFERYSTDNPVVNGLFYYSIENSMGGNN